MDADDIGLVSVSRVIHPFGLRHLGAADKACCGRCAHGVAAICGLDAHGKQKSAITVTELEAALVGAVLVLEVKAEVHSGAALYLRSKIRITGSCVAGAKGKAAVRHGCLGVKGESARVLIKGFADEGIAVRVGHSGHRDGNVENVDHAARKGDGFGERVTALDHGGHSSFTGGQALGDGVGAACVGGGLHGFAVYRDGDFGIAAGAYIIADRAAQVDSILRHGNLKQADGRRGGAGGGMGVAGVQRCIGIGSVKNGVGGGGHRDNAAVGLGQRGKVKAATLGKQAIRQRSAGGVCAGTGGNQCGAGLGHQAVGLQQCAGGGIAKAAHAGGSADKRILAQHDGAGILPAGGRAVVGIVFVGEAGSAAEAEACALAVVEHIVDIGGRAAAPRVKVGGAIAVLAAVKDIVAELEVTAAHRVMDIGVQAVLNQVVADDAGVEFHAAEQQTLAAVMDIIVLDQDVGGAPVGVDGVGVLTTALVADIKDLVVLDSNIVGKEQLNAAGADMLQ